MKLNDTILYYRKRAGLSQEALAAKIGVSRQAVSKWELGETTPDVEKLVLLAKAFGVTTDELLGLAEPARETVGEPKREREQVPAGLPPISEDLNYILRNYGRFSRWYYPIFIGPVMLIVGIYGCITEWHIYKIVPYMWRASLLPFCASAALAALGAGMAIWGVVRLVRHKQKEKNNPNQERKP